MTQWKYIMGSMAIALSLFACQSNSSEKGIVYNLADYGVVPNSRENTAPILEKALAQIADMAPKGEELVIQFPAGRYDFYPEEAPSRTYYISNHDQSNPKSVGIALEEWKDLTLDGQGAEFIFHGRMLPISLIGSENCTLKDFHIDFEQPHITQAQVIANDTIQGKITLEMAPWVQYTVEQDTLFVQGEGWKHRPLYCIAFEPETRRLVYRTSDVPLHVNQVKDLGNHRVEANNWKNAQLVPGTVLAMRTWQRPAPGIFLYQNKDTKLEKVQVHYAEGMGLLAQLCDQIELDSFSVCLRGAEDPRYFTTQADATHFSGCKGKIISRNGLYENMMDDAINVHGTYLKVEERIDDHTLIAAYKHNQSYGFDWGYAGNTVQFIRSRTMEMIEGSNRIVSIAPADPEESKTGIKHFRITFQETLPEAITPDQSIGIENLTWTPEVLFANNIVRHNRARGSLFSTPRRTLVENNLFDHTSGTAILLCGDCNGWYETGACKDVLIRNNRFVNALTNMFQFTNAVISIYPEIPDLEHQRQYFHSGIVIEGNIFETFDHPILYAKSVDGLIFRNNTIIENNQYPPFHWNKQRFLLERVVNEEIY